MRSATRTSNLITRCKVSLTRGGPTIFLLDAVLLSLVRGLYTELSNSFFNSNKCPPTLIIEKRYFFVLHKNQKLVVNKRKRKEKHILHY